jgi:hypothetical protein
MTSCVRHLLVIAFLMLAMQPAWSQSKRTYAECLEMTEKYAARHVEKGDKATAKHRRDVDRIVADFVKRLPPEEQANSYIPLVVERLVDSYAPETSRKTLITEAAEKAVQLEDSENFQCAHEYTVRHRFINKANDYEARLKAVEDAIYERLDLESLGPDEGLVVVSFRAEGYAEHIVINRLGGVGGGIRFGPLRNEEYFRVLKVKAGDYEWNKIWSSGWLYRTSMYVKRGDFKFTVEPGKLNYTGQFLYRNSWSKGNHASVRDRASVVLTQLEENYPEILENYAISNGLGTDERFFEFYLNAKRAAPTEEDGA